MVNPGTFHGSRKEFLMGEKEAYATAVADGYAMEALSLIQQRYFRRYPIEIPLNKEPTAEHLASVDDSAPIPEPKEPDTSRMTEQEALWAKESLEEKRKLIEFRKAQIKRWFAYQYMKDTDVDPKDTGAFNPYRQILYLLTGQDYNRPRQKSAANVWRKTRRNEIEQEAKRLHEEAKSAPVPEGKKAESLVTIRDRVAREMFKELSDDEQRQWLQKAIAEHHQSLQKWKDEMNGKLSKEPADRQVAIQGLIRFMQPILDMLGEATGWKCSFIAGGPEPAQGGLFNVVSVHSGTTGGDVKLCFGRAERARFRKVVVPMYGSFLQSCYTPEECRARALPIEEGHLRVTDLDIDTDRASSDNFPWYSPPTQGVGSSTLPGSSDPVATQTPSSEIPSTETPAAIKPPSRPHRKSTHRKPPMRKSTSRQKGSGEAASKSSPKPPSTAAPSTSTTPSISVGPQGGHALPPVGSEGQTVVPTPSAGPALSAGAPVGVMVASGGMEADKAVTEVDIGPEDSDSNPFPFDIPPSSPSAPLQRSPPPSPAPSPQRSPCGSPAPSRAVDSQTAPTPVEPDAASRRSSRVRGRIEKEGTRVDVDSLGGGQKRGREDSNDNATSESVSPRPSKKARVQKSTEVEIPLDAPDWFKKALAMLSSSDLGEDWAHLVRLWKSYEAAAGYKGAGLLGAANRPAAIKDWVQRARSPSWRPKINLARFAVDFRSWWASLQPEWRVGEDGKVLSGVDGDWEKLQKPGVNGLLSVLAALFFWGAQLPSSSSRSSSSIEWADTVKNCIDVYSHLLQST